VNPGVSFDNKKPEVENLVGVSLLIISQKVWGIAKP
jgi:hypothetical protein